MATWQELRQYIAANHNLVDVNNDLLTVEFRLNSGRTQLVFISGSSELFIVKSPFAKVGSVQPGKVLESAKTYGACIVGDMYALTHVQPMESLDVVEVELAIQLMANSADEIEAALGAGDNF